MLTKSEINLLGRRLAEATTIYKKTGDKKKAQAVIECGLCLFATYQEMEDAAKLAGVDLVDLEEMLYAVS